MPILFIPKERRNGTHSAHAKYVCSFSKNKYSMATLLGSSHTCRNTRISGSGVLLNLGLASPRG